MIVVWYVALAAMLFGGAKICKSKTWNEENMSFDQTKCFLGFGAVVISFHHMSQVTCAPWMDPQYIRHGLDIFVTAGYPMVAIFLLCSGYGLYKSASTKPDFFKRFLPVRLVPVLIPAVLTTLVYVCFRLMRNLPIKLNNPVAFGEHETLHPYIWYIPCMIVMYLLFYIGFGIFKKESFAIFIVAFGTFDWVLYCIRFAYEPFWFNAAHMFLIGILVAKYEKKFFESCKKLYVLRLIGTVILCVILWYSANHAGTIYLWLSEMSLAPDNGNIADLFTAFLQSLYTLAFMSLFYLLGMKIKLGNPVLRFFSKFTLEFYLVHGIFIHMFGYCMIYAGIEPVYYIKNVPLFILVVLGLSTPAAYGLSIVDKKVGKLLKPKSK